MVEEVFNNAIDSLSDDDKQLPQVGFDVLHYYSRFFFLTLHSFHFNIFVYICVTVLTF